MFTMYRYRFLRCCEDKAVYSLTFFQKKLSLYTSYSFLKYYFVQRSRRLIYNYNIAY